MDSFGIIVLAYFIGSFPHLLIMARVNHISTDGDLHMALWQQAGPFIGLSVVIVDVLKGIGTIWLVRLLGFNIETIVACGIVATMGQMWPVWKGFDGEKGNTTGYGAAAAIALIPTLLALTGVLMGLMFKLFRALRLKDIPKSEGFSKGAGPSIALPVGVAIGFVLLPFTALWLGQPQQVVVGFAVLSTLIFIRRLTAGLGKDLKTQSNRMTIFWQRLLLDRGQN